MIENNGNTNNIRSYNNEIVVIIIRIIVIVIVMVTVIVIVIVVLVISSSMQAPELIKLSKQSQETAGTFTESTEVLLVLALLM